MHGHAGQSRPWPGRRNTFMQVGFVGLGLMGLAMARNVIEGGHRVTGYDPQGRALQALAAGGGSAAPTPAAAAAQSQIVVVMVPNDADVREAVLGKNGISAGLASGDLVLVMSTISPGCTMEVGAAVLDRGQRYLEAPVTRSSQHAVDGELGILVGGAPTDLERARPILGLMGSDITHCGPVGTGAAMKLVNNMLAGSISACVQEAMVLGRKAGLQLETMREVLRGTAANCSALDTLARNLAAGRTFEPGFRVALQHKDLRLATTWASEIGAITPMGSTFHQVLGLSMAAGYADLDAGATLRVFEGAAATQLP